MPSTINFALPWEGLRAGGQALSGLGGDPQSAMANLGSLYQSQYDAALSMNQKNNENVQLGYQGLRDEASQTYQNIYKDLDARYSDVLGRIAGTNTSNLNDISRNATAQSGAASQQMVSRGLGNSTVQQNLQRAIEADRNREATRSNEAFAQLGAGYADRIWGDRMAARQSRAQVMGGLGQAQLGAQERIQAGYPDAAMFGSLAQMYGSQAESQAAQKQMGNNFFPGYQVLGGASAGYTRPPSRLASRDLASGRGYAGDWGGGSGGGGGGYYGGGGGSWAPASPQQIADGQRFFGAVSGGGGYGGGDGGDYDPSMEGGGGYDPSYYESSAIDPGNYSMDGDYYLD